MAYIGKIPTVGNFQKCDAITESSTATYNLTVGSVAVFPETANNCIVSLNGVIQAPTDAYTIVGSTIVFNSSLTSADVIDFILILGNVLDIGTPSDATVSTAKVADDAITLAKMASGTDGNVISYDASGNPVAIATGSDGQVLTSTGAGSPPAFEAAPSGKVKQIITAQASGLATDSTNFSGQDTGTIGDIGTSFISQAITPTNASSIIVVNASSSAGLTSNSIGGAGIFAGSTCKAWNTTNGQSTDGDGFAIHCAFVAGGTSAITIQFRSIGSYAGSATRLGAMKAGDGGITNPLGQMTIMEVLN
tara:strand:+ start:688 stop:1605 length:918 start_codon:yes stop_codon:yes gene_type:complete